MTLWKKMRQLQSSSDDTNAGAAASNLLEKIPYSIAERGRTLFNKSAFTIAFLPERPQPRHLIWGANRLAGGTIIKDPHKADAVFYFEEKTKAHPPRRPNPLAPGFNFFCLDISPSHIATTFESIFGYALTVNPQTHAGPMTVKSKRSDLHDNAIIDGPTAPKPRRVYQRLIDNEIHAGFVVNFRCPTVKGEVPLVYVAMRPVEQRFGQVDKNVALVEPDAVFSSLELDQISRFCSEIGLDWGSLDILRDKTNGRLYIVDVDKTETGPPESLSLKDKLRSTEILGEALKDAIIDQPGVVPRTEYGLRADNDSFDISDAPIRIVP